MNIDAKRILVTNRPSGIGLAVARVQLVKADDFLSVTS